LRPLVRLFAPLRDNVTSSAQSPAFRPGLAPHMIASIQGDVIRTLGPVWHCERELLHTASNLFIEHKTLRYPRAT
jgi:hypothetical protein